MRDNFRPNVRLATNILMVIGTFLIAYKIGSIAKYEKTFQQRKVNCAKTIALDIPELKPVSYTHLTLPTINWV